MSQTWPIPPDNMQITQITDQQPFFTVQMSLTDESIRLHTRVTDIDVVEGMIRVYTRDPDGEEVQVHFYAPGTWQEAHTMTSEEGEELASVFDYMHTNLYSHTNHFAEEDHS